MHTLLRTLLGLMLLPWLLLPASASENINDDERERRMVGAVFTMTNAVDGNEVLAYRRGSDGALTPAGVFSTGGLGTGGGLGNQGGLVLSQSGRLLFAVNAGSNQISVFAVRHGGLVLRDIIDSGGIRPVSIAVDHGLLYVLNAGSDNITGFYVTRRGKLKPLPGSTRPLSGSGTAPAQIEFSPKEHILVVTEKATNIIDTYQVNDDGLLDGPVVHTSAGATPFGFAFDQRGRLFVSEAAGGAPDGSSVSSYRVLENGGLDAISSAVPTTETAACWVVITRNGRFAYTTNTGSGSVSAYRISQDGSLELRDPDGRAGDTGAGSRPIDMALSRNSHFLYTLNAGNNTISAFHVGSDGTLSALPGVTGLSAGANGLVAR